MKHISIAVFPLLAVLLALTGCAGAKRLDGSGEEQFRASFTRVLSSLDDDGQEKFKDALAQMVWDEQGDALVSMLAGKAAGPDLAPDKVKSLLNDLMSRTSGMSAADVETVVADRPQLKTSDMKSFKESIETVKAALEPDNLDKFNAALDLMLLNNGGDAARRLMERKLADEKLYSTDEKKIKTALLKKFKDKTARDVVVLAQKLPRIDGSSREAFSTSMNRVRNSLTADQKLEFSDAVFRLSFPEGTEAETPGEVAGEDSGAADSGGEAEAPAQDQAALWDQVMSRLDGLTGGEVIELAKVL